MSESVCCAIKMRVEGQKVCVLPHGLGGLVDLKDREIRALQAFGPGFGALGGRGVNNLWLIGLSD